MRFFEDRAEVSRVAKAELQSGRQWLRIADISPLVDDRSVQAACKGAKVLAARVFRRIKGPTEFASTEIEQAEKQAQELQGKLDTLNLLNSRHEKRLQYMGELFETWSAGIAKVPRFSADATLESWTGAYHDLMNQDSEELSLSLIHI